MAKIILKTVEDKSVEFRTVGIGEVVSHDNKFYMVTNSSYTDGSTKNAVNLASGRLVHFTPTARCEVADSISINF